ncbi:MAG: hypothetical protein WC761_02485 [Candidatus Paceibacterota bacterium]|jgi:hypothetical protein
MDLKDLHQSRTVRGILIGIIATLIVITIFQAGVFVGYRKAAFSFRMGDNYYKTFRGGEAMKVVGFDNGPIPGGHGAVGRIVRINLPELVIVSEGDIEKTVIIGSSTLIKRFDDNIPPQEIMTDDYAVILGSPDEEAKIIAKFVRLIPTPQMMGQAEIQ